MVLLSNFVTKKQTLAVSWDFKSLTLIDTREIILNCELYSFIIATYLPEVALQQKWNQEKTIASLVRKTGYTGKIDEELLATISCKRYQSSKQRLTYEEYISIVGYDPIQATNAKKKNSSTSSWKKYFGWYSKKRWIKNFFSV